MTDFTNGPQDQEVSYTYWPNGNRKTMVSPAGTFSYTYDAVGRLNELENPFSETSTWDYYANGSLAAQNLANGASAFYSYNDRGLLSLLDNEVGGGDIFGIFEGPNSGDHMTYDAAGNRTGMGVIGSLADSVVHPGNVYYTYTSKHSPQASKDSPQVIDDRRVACLRALHHLQSDFLRDLASGQDQSRLVRRKWQGRLLLSWHSETPSRSSVGGPR